MFIASPHLPMHYEEIIPRRPVHFWAHDACEEGIGGVFFAPDGAPFLWALPIPPALHNLVHINVLELAAHVVQLEMRTPFLECLEHALDGMDSLVGLSWIKKGSVTNDSCVADLLMWRACILRASHTVSSCTFMRGDFNKMADAASRLTHLSPAELCRNFDLLFPQERSWTMLLPTSEIEATLTSVLSRRQCTRSWCPILEERCAPIGPSGLASAAAWGSHQISRESPTPSHFYKSLHIECTQESTPLAGSEYESGLWSSTSAPWARRSPAWGAAISASVLTASWISGSPVNSVPTRRRTHHPPE